MQKPLSGNHKHPAGCSPVSSGQSEKEMLVLGRIAFASPPPRHATTGSTDSQKDCSFPTVPQGKLKKKKKGKVKAISGCSHLGSPNSIHLGYSEKMLINKRGRQTYFCRLWGRRYGERLLWKTLLGQRSAQRLRHRIIKVGKDPSDPQVQPQPTTICTAHILRCHTCMVL